jgi:(1->4)-alpha-D-glucan 1-alpha-D-glucosylmutase
MLKAAKEAKIHTSWINPNTAYEQALAQFVSAILDRSQPNSFLDDFHAFQPPVASLGMFNALSQTLLKFASPGVADVYQGNEIWDFSLVDPDNRRPVDYKLRRQLLAEIDRRVVRDRAALAGELLRTREDGRIKLYVTHRCLELRQDCPGLFMGAGYQALRATGDHAAHVCAFARLADGGQTAIAVAPVLAAGLTRGVAAPIGEDVWAGTRLSLPRRLPTSYRDAFTGQTFDVDSTNGRPQLPLKSILSDFPVALLISE